MEEEQHIMAEWDSTQYLKFEKERSRAAIDLANRIELEAPKRGLDLGCGPGNSTRVLAERFPAAHHEGNLRALHLGVELAEPLLD